MKNKILVLFGIAILLFLQSCYLLKQGAGQVKLRLDQVSLDKAIEKEENREIKKLLAEVPEIKKFAVAHLELQHNDNYTSYYATDKAGIAFVVTASPKVELKPYTWWFPIIGSVPYKGFFEKKDAIELETELQEKGYDTWLFAAPAYSTLGWFNDPITTPMLKRGYYSLVATLIHEMVHTTLYVEGEGDFNEQLASFVEDKGTMEYLEYKGLLTDDKAVYLENQKAKRKEFLKLMSKYTALLEGNYAGDLSKEEKLLGKQALYQELQKEVEVIYPGRPKEFWRFNNARMLQYNRYREDSDLLNGLWRQSNSDWKHFWLLVNDYVDKQGW